MKLYHATTFDSSCTIGDYNFIPSADGYIHFCATRGECLAFQKIRNIPFDDITFLEVELPEEILKTKHDNILGLDIITYLHKGKLKDEYIQNMYLSWLPPVLDI